MGDDSRSLRRWPAFVVFSVGAALAASCSPGHLVSDGGVHAQAQANAEHAVRSAEVIGSWRTPTERAASMGSSADVLAYSGDAEHSRYTIRTEATGRDGFGSPLRVVLCFDVEFDAWSAQLSSDRDCPPDAQRLDLQPPPVATLPATTPDDLRSALDQAVSAPATGLELEDAVRSLLGDASIEIAKDGAVGVAMSAGRQCVLGRVTADRVVEVWVPPELAVAPGELGCTGDTAAQGLAKDS